MIKKFALVVAAVALMGNSAFAADMSSVRAARLGLAGMQPMSHAQAHQVRGQGIAAVGGISTANLVLFKSYGNVQTGTNATAANGKIVGLSLNNFAAGGSVAFAR